MADWISVAAQVALVALAWGLIMLGGAVIRYSLQPYARSGKSENEAHPLYTRCDH